MKNMCIILLTFLLSVNTRHVVMEMFLTRFIIIMSFFLDISRCGLKKTLSCKWEYV
jgi:hypothetical protein